MNLLSPLTSFRHKAPQAGFLTILFLSFSISLLIPTVGVGQTQLDLQGKSTSTDTVAKVRVNYKGERNVIGLSVHSDPSSGFSFGIGGQFFGGLHGLYGQSGVGTGVRGISTSGAGVLGSSTDNIGVYGFSNVAVGVVGASNNAGSWDFDAQGAGMNYGSTSSRRWKKNIRAIPDPLSKLTALRGVYFDWDMAHGGQQDLGCIAEEVGAVLPEIVGYEANGIDATSMDYSKLTPLLIEATKAMRKEYMDEIQALYNEIASLRSQLLSLQSGQTDNSSVGSTSAPGGTRP